MSRATVGVNLLWLVPAVVGGSEEYTLRLLRSVSDLAPDDLRLRLYAQPAFLDAHVDLNDRFETDRSPALPGKAGRIAAESTWLAARTRHDDLVHHGGGVVPPLATAPAVVTIHDLQPLDQPENFGPIRRRWFEAMLPHAVRASRLCLTPSQFTADRLQDRLGANPDRIRVVHHGHEAVSPGVVDPDQHRRWLDRYGRFLLLPAIAYPHKRHIDLVDVIDELRSRFPDLTAVMTGGPGPETERLLAVIGRRDLGRRCHYLGRVDGSTLDSLYRSATALVFPSTYEGFGNPVLEAMARGCPVVSTTAGAIPEVAGDAALLVEPARPDALAEAVTRLVVDDQLADTLRARGVERAADFGWHQSGRALISAYRDGLA